MELVAIVTNLSRGRSGRTKQLWQTNAGIVALAAVFIGAEFASVVRAQIAAPPDFDAASIKPNNSPPGGREGIRSGALHYTPGRIVGRNVSAWRMILEAYHLQQYQLSGGPGWLESDRFSVEAKAENSADEDQLRLMLRTLLSRRFKLAVHHDIKEMAVYALTVGRNGPKLLELKEGESAPSSAAEMISRGVPMPKMEHVAGVLAERGSILRLVDLLNRMGKFDRSVIDRTGLKGDFFFAFWWDAEENFMAEIQEQSGLKFVSLKAPVDVLVIDHVERPRRTEPSCETSLLF